MKRFLLILAVVLIFGAVLFNFEEISTTVKASKELVAPSQEVAALALERVQEVSPKPEEPSEAAPLVAAEVPPEVPEAPDEDTPVLLLYADSSDEAPSSLGQLEQMLAEEVIQDLPDEEERSWIRERFPEVTEDQLNAYRELLIRIVRDNVLDFAVGVIKGLPRDILVSAVLSFISTRLPFGKKRKKE